MGDGDGEAEQPRLCHVVKVDTFDGYGFNLLAEHGRPGQYIGKVDAGSPAELAGLRKGDKILEVNGASVADDDHKQVVAKIKSNADEAKLLVVTQSQQSLKDPSDKDKNQTKDKDQAKDKLDLAMTAAEMRARLQAKKRADPKAAKIDFKSKFDIVKQL